MRKFTLVVILLNITLALYAQKDSLDSKVVRKKGWSFGALPAISYDSDLGFRYGALANVYHFGDGSRYPTYDHSLYVEWSRTTKGNGINQITYDSDRLIPKTRVTAEASFYTEKALDFYGFNGYESNFNADFSDKEKNDYITRMFYRLDREVLRFKGDFQINLIDTKLRALAGYTYLNTNIDSVDVQNINDGASDDKKVPLQAGSLYKDYVNAGIIADKYKHGGSDNLFKIGLVYDTRNAWSYPTKGIWAESFLLTDPGFSNEGYGKLIFNWRQYITLIPHRITFAYRVSLQPKLWGDIPWYMLPYSYNTSKDRDGLGGAKTLRGVLRNRVVGDGVAFTNIEFRTIPFRTVIANQNFYIGLVPFVDMGMVIQKTDIDYSNLSTHTTSAGHEVNIQPVPSEDEKIHLSFGAELKLVLNDNFIVSVSYGISPDERDGGSGLYIGLNYLF